MPEKEYLARYGVSVSRRLRPNLPGERSKLFLGCRRGRLCYGSHAEIRELVGALVAIVAGVTFHPQPHDVVLRGELVKEFGYANPMQVPRLDKVVLNIGVGEGVADSKKVTAAAADLGLIAGQKPVITKARKSIATFKLREGMPIGAKVTLRKNRMYEFIDRLVNIALPRERDFRGLNPKSFDGRGNYTLGLKEHIIFPEIDYDKVADVLGMDIIVCTTARTDDEARALLRGLDFPFRQ